MIGRVYPVYISNWALSRFGKTNSSFVDFCSDTASQILSSDDPESFDFLILSTFCPEIYLGETHQSARIATKLGLKNAFAIRSETASSSGASAIHLGAGLIQSGRFKKGLIIGCEIMSSLDRTKSNLVLGSVLSPKEQAMGMSMAQGGAMIANRYLNEFGYSKDDLYFISKKLHDNGLKNPIAQIQKNLTPEEYHSAPKFCSPLGLYDISPLSDGCSALILTSNPSEVQVSGMGHSVGGFHLTGEPSFINSKRAFQMAYKESNSNPQSILAAELHDAFTIFEIIGMEDAELFPKGKGLEAVKNHETHPDSRLPINPSGGLKSRGHPIGASGVAQVVELIQFMKSNQKNGFGLTHSIGGLATNNFVTIIETKF
jgi:acetyl-CoA acetyltransferase